MERQYTRLDEARNLIDPIIKGIEDEEAKRGALKNPMEDYFYNNPRIQQVIKEIV